MSRTNGSCSPDEKASERFCRGCRHSLRGVVSGRCPECGRAFDPNNPRTTLPHACHEFWIMLAGISKAAAVISGALAGIWFLNAALGRDVMLPWIMTLPLLPVLLFIAVVALLPCVPLTRRYRIAVIVSLALIFSIFWTYWPLRLTLLPHKQALAPIVEHVRAEGTQSSPRRVGIFRLRQVRLLENGNVGFQITGDAGGGVYLVHRAPDEPLLWYNLNWWYDLGDDWFLVYED